MKKNDQLFVAVEGSEVNNNSKNRILAAMAAERLFSLVFLCTGIYAVLLMMSAAYFAAADVMRCFLILAPFAAVFSLLFGAGPKIKWPGLIIMWGFFLIYLYYNHEKIGTAFDGCLIYIGKWIAWYVGGRSIDIPDRLLKLSPHMIDGMLMISVLPWCILSAVAWSRRGRHICIAIAVVIYLSIFFSSGYMPDITPLFLFAVSAGGAAICTGPYCTKKDKNNDKAFHRLGKMIFFSLAAMLSFASYSLIFGSVGKMLIPIQNMIYDDYSLEKTYETDKDLPKKEDPQKSSGGISGGNTGRGGSSFVPKGDICLTVEFDKDIDHNTYLKAFVADTYDGNGWKNTYKPSKQSFAFSNDPYAVMSMEFNIIGSIYSKYNITINGSEKPLFKKINAHITAYSADLTDVGYVCMPYCSLVDQNDGNVQDGYYLKKNDNKSNESAFTFYDTEGGYSKFSQNDFWEFVRENKAFLNISPYRTAAKEMTDFAYIYYLQVPEFLSKIREKYGNPGIDLSNPEEIVKYVKSELRKGFKYDVNPAEVPEGEDFIEYFLFESKRGYCMYYASAAVMMFRCLGLPARYVEGYLVPNAKAGVPIALKDSNAHAWAEVFISGYGWIPVEVTNATLMPSGFVGNEPESETEPGSESEPVEKASKTPKETGEGGKKETKPSGTKETEKGTSAGETAAPGKTGFKIKLSKIEIGFLILLAAGIVFHLLWQLFKVLFDKMYYSRVKSSMSDNYKKRLLLTYKRIYKLTRFYCPVTAECDMEEQSKYYYIKTEELTAFKDALLLAEFGKGKITIEDCKRAEHIEERILYRIYRTKTGPGKYFTRRMLRIRREIHAGK